MEPILSDELYTRFRDLIRARTGLAYPERKRADLAHGLRGVMEAGGYASLALLYADALRGGPAWELLVTQLTIGETYFFRNEPQFVALRERVLPELIERRSVTRTLRCWSAGCATGEEPYSLAMLLADMLPASVAWQPSILGTDINPQFLARARQGLYGEWSFRETSEAQRQRFFAAEGARWRLRPEVRQMVTFMPLNLAETSYPALANGTCAMDLIFCRNVTIYFDEETTRQVAERLYGALTPGGWLVVGHAEPQATVYHRFEVYNFTDTVLYRKPLDAPMFLSEGSTAPPGVLLQPPKRLGSPRQYIAPALPTPAAQRARTVHAPGPAPAPPPVAARDVAGLLVLARSSLRRGEWQETERACEEAIGQRSLTIEAHYLLAQAYELQGRWSEALAAYRRTVYLDRAFALGLVGMARAWRHLGHPEEAQRTYQRALRQLEQLRPFELVVLAEGKTAAELAILVRQQLQA